MKKMFKPARLFAFMAASAFMFLPSCDDESAEVVDLTAPEIANVANNETVEPGGTLVLTFDLEDNIALGEVKINIHDDFDGHDHGRVRSKAEPFEYESILDEMKGEKTFRVEEQISIPADAATGPYHLQINYFDENGNQGEFYVGTFEISSEAVSPAIAITNFGADDELELDENGILQLEGTVTARTEGGLEEVHILVVHEEEEHGYARLKHDDEPHYNQEWELDGAQIFDLQDIDPAINLSDAASGHYELIITARDTEGNVKVLSREIHVD